VLAGLGSQRGGKRKPVTPQGWDRSHPGLARWWSSPNLQRELDEAAGMGRRDGEVGGSCGGGRWRIWSGLPLRLH
jgi:hypothetical protein